jgi:hypothetical protein
MIVKSWLSVCVLTVTGLFSEESLKVEPQLVI